MAGVDVVVELIARLTGRAVVCRNTLRDRRTLRWVRIGEATSGEDGRGPVVVMESGLGEPMLNWVPVLAGLSEVADTLVVYDRAGVGLSGPAHGGHGGEAQLADLVAVIKDVGCPPCVVVGHSLGGWLAQGLAWRHPELLAGLVLIDPSHEEVFRHIPEEMLAAMNEGIAVYASMSADALVASQADDWRVEAARVSDDPEVQAHIVEAWRACFAADDRVRAIYEEEMAAQRDLPWAQRLRETGVFPKLPSVVLSATNGMPEDMRALFTGLQRQIATELGGAHESVADAGHYIHRDRPKAVIGAVARVVGEVRAAAVLRE